MSLVTNSNHMINVQLETVGSQLFQAAPSCALKDPSGSQNQNTNTKYLRLKHPKTS